jgi:branched-chain amino acid transport system permease protein
MADYLAHLVVMLSVYAMLVYALNLIAGDSGLLAFCLAGFWGVGAYAAALASIVRGGAPYVTDLALAGGAGFELTLPLAAAAGALTGFIAGLASLRFRGDVFILATLSVQALIVSILESADSVTRGPAGLYGIPPPALFGLPLNIQILSLFSAGVAIVTIIALAWLRGTSLGLQLRALRDHERAACALGVPPTRRYLVAFAIAGAVAGLAGGLYVGRAAYIDPASFGLPESILLVTALLVGGRGVVLGPLAGTAVLVLVPEALRFVGLDVNHAAAIRSAMLGALLVCLVFLRPRGLARERRG